VNRKLAVLAIIVAVFTGMPCAGETPAKKGPAAAPAAPAAPTGGVIIRPSAPAAPVIANIEEGQKVAEIQAVLAAGECDKAIEAANTFMKTARDEGARTETLRVLAEAYRKKGDWRQAPPAYQRLRERFDKNSDEYARYDAIAEILRYAPAGVYQPVGAAPVKPPAGGAQTLTDDAVLAEALTRLAGSRGSRMKSRIATVTRGSTPQLVVAAFAPLAEEARQIYSLSADAPTDGPREVAAAVGNRLQALSAPVIASLKSKLDRLQPKMVPYSATITNLDKTEIRTIQAACKELVEAERKFQEGLLLTGGKGDWPDQETLRKESAERLANYEQLSKQFIIPPSYGSLFR